MLTVQNLLVSYQNILLYFFNISLDDAPTNYHKNLKKIGYWYMYLQFDA